MKINFEDLEKMDYETGRKTLLAADYIQNKSEVDGEVNDEYYTLYNENGDSEIHVVSYVTYTQITNDEPAHIKKDDWHWSEL